MERAIHAVSSGAQERALVLSSYRMNPHSVLLDLLGPKMEFLPPARPHGDRDSDLVGSRWEQGRSRLPRARPREHVAEIPRRSLHRGAAAAI